MVTDDKNLRKLTFRNRAMLLIMLAFTSLLFLILANLNRTTIVDGKVYTHPATFWVLVILSVLFAGGAFLVWKYGFAPRDPNDWRNGIVFLVAGIVVLILTGSRTLIDLWMVGFFALVGSTEIGVSAASKRKGSES